MNDVPQWFTDMWLSLSDEPERRKQKYIWAEVSRHLDHTSLRTEALRTAAILNAAVLTGAVQRAEEEQIGRIIGTASETASFTTEMAEHFMTWLVEAQP